MPQPTLPEPDLKAPSLGLLLMEIRVVAEWARYWVDGARLGSLPAGDGHPVMVIPGFGAGDGATAPLRKTLARLGYVVEGWGYGVNLGMRPRIRSGLEMRLRRLSRRHRAPVSLIGWSLGGIFAREMARQQPEIVRQVITLGSPINGHPEANNVDRLFRLANRRGKSQADHAGFLRRIVAPPVPCVAIHSKTDGVVAWRCSREEESAATQNIEVSSSHFGLTANPEVIAVIAGLLARPSRPI